MRRELDWDESENRKRRGKERSWRGALKQKMRNKKSPRAGVEDLDDHGRILPGDRGERLDELFSIRF